jgi:energy-coupling factor transporter ATP-binding protein EcfA2
MSGPVSTPPPIVAFDRVSITYPEQSSPTLRGIDLAVAEGEFLLLVGPTGSGKSTLLRAINGLVPHFSGGTVHGTVTVAGRSTATHPPRTLADVVGMVPQDPMASFVTDTVEEELAYTMESLGLPGPVMRRRVEEILDLLGLADLRSRPLQSLSGGQRQRVAIGAVLTANPAVLVLDEPTSALDPGAAEDVLSSLQRLVHDLGLTVIIAEHRLERVVQYADRIAILPGRGEPLIVGDPGPMMLRSPVAPPVVQLARAAGWYPMPLSVRHARRFAPNLREQLAGRSPRPRTTRTGADAPIATTRLLGVQYGRTTALRDVTVDILEGEVVALMGRNGAGKSTLLAALIGSLRPARGQVRVLGKDPAALSGRDLLQRIGMVPQNPGDLLVAERVDDECAQADHDAEARPGTALAIVQRLAPTIRVDSHPRDLSEGQRLILALAVVLASSPRVLLLDEPTRGLDYESKAALVEVLLQLRQHRTAVILATHDVELAAEVADRVVVLAEGEVVADGLAHEVVVGSPMFAPQVAKILGEGEWLTVRQVLEAVGA